MALAESLGAAGVVYDPSNKQSPVILQVLAEAMAMELPIVSTDISGIPELVDQRVDGLLVPQKNAAALAEAIAELLEDAALRQRLGQAAREKICRIFDAEATVVELHQLLQSCL